MHLKLSSAKWRPFSRSLNALTHFGPSLFSFPEAIKWTDICDVYERHYFIDYGIDAFLCRHMVYMIPGASLVLCVAKSPLVILLLDGKCIYFKGELHHLLLNGYSGNDLIYKRSFSFSNTLRRKESTLLDDIGIPRGFTWNICTQFS